MKQASAFLKTVGIYEPTLILDQPQMMHNIADMVNKASRADVRLRPHFKTHQSAAIGERFRQAGVTAITVSSMKMAAYFAAHGWRDITVAIPFNPGEVELINRLAGQIQLNLIVDSLAAIDAIAGQLKNDVHVWIEIDTGYGRTGVRYEQGAQVLALVQQIQATPHAQFAGLLTHNGQTYHARTREAIVGSYEVSLARMHSLQALLRERGFGNCELSIGDTPSASVLDSFRDVAELRPGNFVFYDLMQAQIGACASEQIALAVACPVIGVYPEREQIVVHGGAVHFSKERLNVGGKEVYGYATTIGDGSLGPAMTEAPLISISQEHGTLQADRNLLDQVTVGDLIPILPVHSCLTANLYAAYTTLTGERLPLMPKSFQAT